jgi:diguanylate cyclase (GGDEF)-like protein
MGPPARACSIAERLRKQVSAVTLRAADALVTVTVSIGVAELGRYGDELFGLLASADAAVYRAKGAGRNQVCLPPPGARPPAARPSVAQPRCP